uniref:Uncharacterized protein n=1 Tax=Anguilla anguilla TaxID=7936 RepID=A0A0E9Y1K5_ANGAN
MIMNPSRSL